MNFYTTLLFCELTWGPGALPHAVSDALSHDDLRQDDLRQDDFETPIEEPEDLRIDTSPLSTPHSLAACHQDELQMEQGVLGVKDAGEKSPEGRLCP